MKRFSLFLKKKRPRNRRKSPGDRALKIIFTAIALLLALNIALILPLDLGGLLYSAELIVIQYFASYPKIQMWLLWLLILFAVLYGKFFVPELSIPQISRSLIYYKREEEGEFAYFKTLRGWVVQVHMDFVKKSFLRYTVVGDITKVTREGKYLILQSDKMEASKANYWEEQARLLAKMLSDLEDTIERGEVISLDTFERIAKNMRGGGGEG